MTLLLASVMILLTSLGYAFDEPSSFRGVKWGSSPEQAKKIMEQTENVSFINDLGDGTLYFVQATEEGGLTILLNFLDEKFVAGSIGFAPRDFETMEAAFRKRYGAPTQSRQFWVQNAMRAKFLQREITWVGKSTKVQLVKYASSVTDSIGIVGQIAWFNHLAKKQKEKIRDTAKGL